MYGQPPRFHGGGGRGRAAPSHQPHPQATHLNPNYPQNPNLFFQNPNLMSPYNLFSPNPGFPIQTPNFPIQKPNFPIQNRPRPNEALERVDRAVTKARQDLVAAGESVSAWKVCQAALLILKADSWDSLGFQMQQVPSLYRLIVTEGKINAFIHCFVGVRRITSLYDLEVAICEDEGVEQFEDLNLGPLLWHELVIHYFGVSSNVKNVFKITSEEIIASLYEFMKTSKGKEVKADELLDFIAEKNSVHGRELLTIRIQSLGMHITFIRQARNSENHAVNKYLLSINMKAGKKGKKRPLFSTQKKQLDEHFGAISQRVTSFTSAHEEFGGKHIRFVSSSSEDVSENDDEDESDEDENNLQSKHQVPPQNKSSSDRVSSCPYPSVAEELTRLGLKNEMDLSRSPTSDALVQDEPAGTGRSKRMRKTEDSSCATPVTRKLPKREEADVDLSINNKKQNRNALKLKKKKQKRSEVDEADLSLDSNSIRTFVMTWKEACRENNVTKVLDRMFQFYRTKQKRKVKANFMSYPSAGLLNVAIKAIKTGMCDSIYDTFQTLNEQGVASPLSDKSTENISIEVEPSEKHAAVPIGPDLMYPQGFTAEDILNKISSYFMVDLDNLGTGSQSLEGKISFLRKLCKCEFWLAEQFSVEDFQFLGYGDFFMFLEKHVSQLPHSFRIILTGEMHDNNSFEAHMHQRQLDVLLFQALNSLSENENLSEQKILELLGRQFPSISFKLVKSGSLKDIQGVVKENKHNQSSNCVIFSAALLGKSSRGSSFLDHSPETSAVGPVIGQTARVLGSVTTKDAIEALIRAPMLTDLDSWSHWGLIYAPSLGPLLAWLLSEVNAEELQCLVTKSGEVVRIDHSATLDSFLEAFLKGSAFETAVQLLSLLALYGGECNVPISLLRCHARKAFEVLLKNSMEDEKPFGSENKNRGPLDKAIPLVSKFILDFLGYLPMEVRSFAADLMLLGLQSVTKEAPLAILKECRHTEQRYMLHEVGLSLGILDWINDYHTFCLTEAHDSTMSTGPPCLNNASSESNTATIHTRKSEDKFPSSKDDLVFSVVSDQPDEQHKGVCNMNMVVDLGQHSNPAMVIESIRREEFGLDPSLTGLESSLLKKQHARLGRALHCLSQELYSQDSHFLLELIQNADDNVYPAYVDPTLTFILLERGIVVLNNEKGFSAENIKALCDVGNSTKKEASAGYIGKKGIGFKSVFRVSDAPEIHSNGFHIKFDISEGQIGFVLPTVVPPCDIDMFSGLVNMDSDPMDKNCWNTCIVLPFRSKFSEVLAMDSIISMFSDLHPSLLLFLHRLQSIKFRNMINDSFIVMRKEVVGDGIIQVSLGNEKMTWLVVSDKLVAADIIRPGVTTTEISLAFTLHDSGNGDYVPHLDPQPVFAYLPLRTYGMKFILQGDFILPSSREEVDGDSPWNQWLLSKFPDLFINAERSFCGLPCFKENPGEAVAAFMSFVPLVGEVHGFFSSLHRMIISKLRQSNCLILEGDGNEWVPPCKVLRNWTEQARALLPDSLLHKHLGIGLLHRGTVLSDSLARALGIEEYGPKILLQFISSLCYAENGLRSMGLVWLASWLSAIYSMSFRSGQVEPDTLTKLRKLPFVPLSDGKYGSLTEGTIWLHYDGLSTAADNEHLPDAFPKVYANLRIVSPALFAPAAGPDVACFDSSVENITRMLYLVGVEKLSAHEIVKVHILPAISSSRDKDLMTEYFAFIMFHLQSNCANCFAEREQIISELRNKVCILTNHDYKRPAEVAIHFGKDYGNSIDTDKLIDGVDMKWHKIDNIYLKHPFTKSLSGGNLKWRAFFQELGLTDFVQIVKVEKSVTDVSHVLNSFNLDRDMISSNLIAEDWESQELFNLLSQLSSNVDKERSKYLLEVIDSLWDDYFSDKVTGYYQTNCSGDKKPFKSSLMSALQDIRWVASSMDEKVHFPKDLFHDCETVRSVLGFTAPYAVPKVKSEKLLKDLGFKVQISLDDILSALQVWRMSQTPLMASISQMVKLYTFISNERVTSNHTITENFTSGAFIFVPYSSGFKPEDVVPGVLLSPEEVYWHDSTGLVDHMKVICPSSGPAGTHSLSSKMLCNIYSGLHDFFVNECGVNEIPHLRNYLQILLQLSAVALPSESAKVVYQVLLMWADGLKSGTLSTEDVDYFKESLLKQEFTVLPTALDKWVSLHPSCGLVCWSDDEKLKKEFKNLNKVDFLYFGDLSDDEKEILHKKISVLMRQLGIQSLSEVVTREAIYYGPADSGFKTQLVNWALPYAQRYIYNAYPDKYTQMKPSGFESIRQMRIVVVEKLYYRNVIKRCDTSSKKRFECSCLLQGNVLYVTQESDSHSVFMELSHLLIDGNPELHLANFLHMIMTMAESGSTEEETEFFILNSQKVLKLPEEEPMWSLPPTENDKTIMGNVTTILDEPNPLKSSKRRSEVNSSWPPADWKTAPGFGYARTNGFVGPSIYGPSSSNGLQLRGDDEETAGKMVHITQIEDSADWTIEEAELAENSGVISKYSESLGDKPLNLVVSNMNVEFESVDFVTPTDNGRNASSYIPFERDQLNTGPTNAQQALLTGRMGELIAYKYLTEKMGGSFVKWVNKDLETGFPYDIIVGNDETSREYIEVKATKSARKDWFHITAREWQFAVEKGELYSIAYVALQNNNNTAKVRIYKNPVRLCQLGQLQLAVVIPRQPKEL